MAGRLKWTMADICESYLQVSGMGSFKRIKAISLAKESTLYWGWTLISSTTPSKGCAPSHLAVSRFKSPMRTFVLEIYEHEKAYDLWMNGVDNGVRSTNILYFCWERAKSRSLILPDSMILTNKNERKENKMKKRWHKPCLREKFWRVKPKIKGMFFMTGKILEMFNVEFIW